MDECRHGRWAGVYNVSRIHVATKAKPAVALAIVADVAHRDLGVGRPGYV